MDPLSEETTLELLFERVATFDRLCGRLSIVWPKDRAWVRVASNRDLPIASMTDDNRLVGQMHSWNEIDLSYEEIAALPRDWAKAISQWRGVYIITDMSDGARYVGSAFGAENMLQRWRAYAQTGHGGNVALKGRSPTNFRFSVLQLVAQDAIKQEVEVLETTWKKRLHTRRFGLNRN